MSGDRRGGPGTPETGEPMTATAADDGAEDGPAEPGGDASPSGARGPERTRRAGQQPSRTNGAAPPPPQPEPAPPAAAEEAEAGEGGLMSRLIRAFTPPSDETPASGPRGLPGMPGLINLRRMRVEEVCVPRAEIDAVSIDISLPDLVKLFRETQYTRLPVFEGTLDEPVGLIHFKDLALRHGFGDGDAFDLRAELRPLLFAPPSMPIGVLLQKMQADRTHMALVIDEYGGVDGLVTLEDLIEQVIGEIEDEHDKLEGQLWTEEAPGLYLAQARTPLDEFEDATGAALTPDGTDEEIDTLGGVVFLLSGRVPARGEVIPHPSGAELEVVDADPRRIKRVRVRMPGARQSAPPRGARPPQSKE